MINYLKFMGIGLVLGLFIEAELKLVAGIKPKGFIVALIAYPILLTLFYAMSRLIDRFISSTWRGDILQYLLVGLIGIAIEWVILGNGLGSNAFQSGMLAMWTTWGFGPRILTRDSPILEKFRKRFWSAFIITALLLVVTVLLTPNPKAKLVISVLALSATYIVWSVWLLIAGWRTR